MAKVIDIFSKKVMVDDTPIKTVDHSEVIKKIKGRFPNLPLEVIESMKKEQVEPYIFGCVHNVQWRYNKGDNIRWNRPMPFPCKVNPKEVEIGKLVYAGGTDPLMWLDKKYGATYNHILNRKGKKLIINTRSDLVAHEEYMNIIDKDNHEINIHVTGDNALANTCEKTLSPGAPSLTRRIKAFYKLYLEGYKVNLVLDVLQKDLIFNKIINPEIPGTRIKYNHYPSRSKNIGKALDLLNDVYKTYSNKV